MPRKAMWLVLAGTALIAAAAAILLYGPLVGLPVAPAGALFICGGLVLTEGFIRRSHLLYNVTEDVQTTADKLKQMIADAQRSVLCTTGSFHYPVYGRLEPILAGKLDEHVEITVISGDCVSQESHELVRRLSAHNNFHFYTCPTNPTPHGVLVDDKHLRIERPHPIGAALRNNVYIERPGAGASLFLKRFDRYRSESQPWGEKLHTTRTRRTFIEEEVTEK